MSRQQQQDRPILGPATARVQESAGPIRVVILPVAKAEEPFRTHIETKYTNWLAEHVQFVGKVAGHLFKKIEARWGVDKDGAPVFVTTFESSSQSAMQKYKERHADSMRAEIEKSFPGAVSQKGFPYELREVANTETVNVLLAEKGITNLQPVGQFVPRIRALL